MLVNTYLHKLLFQTLNFIIFSYIFVRLTALCAQLIIKHLCFAIAEFESELRFEYQIDGINKAKELGASLGGINVYLQNRLWSFSFIADKVFSLKS